MAGTRKLRELERNPLVTLNLDSAAAGQDVVLAFSIPVLVTVSKIVAWTRQGGQLRYRTVP